MNFLHKEEQKNNTTNILLGIIIVLLLIIAVGAFFLGQMVANPTNVPTNTNTNTNNQTQQETNKSNTQVAEASLKVIVVDDKRCTNCPTQEIISSLQGIPNLANANFETRYFSDDGVADYLKENNITKLPAFIFPTNFVNPGINDYMVKQNEGVYLLNTGSEFDPFAKRSEKGYVMVSDDNLALLKEETKYLQGNQDSPYVWFEYTNFACPACQSFHASGIHDTFQEQFGDKMAYATKHFHFFDAAYEPAELIECVADQLGSEGFYAIEDIIFKDKVLDVEKLKESAADLGANVSQIESCMASDRHIATQDSVKENGAKIFGVTATPTNILVNLDTGEYIKTQNILQDAEAFIK